MKWVKHRVVRQKLRELGAVLVSNNGHEKWRLPRGTVVILPVDRGGELSRFVMKSLQEAFAREGLGQVSL